MKKILIFGANGYLGKSFSENKKQKYEFVKYNGRKDLDFTNPNSIEDFLLPDVKIDGILFMQGMSPSVGFDSISAENFQNMFTIDIILPILILRKLKENNKLSKGCCVILISSISSKKGSYDPSYACSKSGMLVLPKIIKRNIKNVRVNTIFLGLVENSPVHKKMTQDFVEKHKSKMENKLVNVNDVVETIDNVLNCTSLDCSEIEIHCGYRT